MSSGSGSSGSSAGYDSKGNVVGSNTFGFEGFSEKAGVTSFSADPGLASFSEGGYAGYKGRAVYGEGKAARTALDKNTGSLIASALGGLFSFLGLSVNPLASTAGMVISGKKFTTAVTARSALNKTFDDFSLAHPETAAYIESERRAAMDEAMEAAFGGGDGEGKPAAEQQTSSAKAAAAAAKAASDKAAADKAKVAQAATDKAAKAVADKAKADEEAKTKATLLAKRRQSSRRYYTSGGAQGLLGQAPVRLKTLLGE